MNLPTYDVKLKSENPYTFDFISEGKNGKIQSEVFIPNKEYKGFIIQRKKL